MEQGSRALRIGIFLLGAGVIALLFALPDGDAVAKQAVSIRAVDGLEVTADLYPVDAEDAPVIVLFHQAGWSRGEYLEIAPRLNRLGFRCLAVDQRSGETVNGVANETARRASAAGKGTSYLDARADVLAALRYVRRTWGGSKLIAWGSSYSASLVLEVAGSRPELSDAVLAFAPGEYFESLGKPATWVRDAAAGIRVPVFVTSARDEEPRWSAIFAAIPSPAKRSFLPEGEGQHGSRALWSRFPESAAYWKAVEAFLAELRP